VGVGVEMEVGVDLGVGVKEWVWINGCRYKHKCGSVCWAFRVGERD